MWIFVPCTLRSSIALLAGQNDVSFVRNFKKCEIDLNLNLKFELEKNEKFRWYTPSPLACLRTEAQKFYPSFFFGKKSSFSKEGQKKLPSLYDFSKRSIKKMVHFL